MSTSSEDQLERLFGQALALPLERRASFLEESCHGDAALYEALTSLLANTGEAEGFFDRVGGASLARVGALLPATPTSLGRAGGDGKLGARVAHFHIVERLGGGGMGCVYKAIDLRLDRTVALKILPHHLSGDPIAKARLIREARAASALEHPNICAIYEVGEDDEGHPYIAMPCYAGSSLKERLSAGPLPLREALEIAAQIVQGLARAHQADIVHRDVKPANIIVTDGGEVKILDFGVAKIAGSDITRDGATIGTIAYMSPEQTRGDALDARTDIWSVGAVLSEMLSGERPFRQQTDGALINAIRHDAPRSLRAVSPKIPTAVGRIVVRCLEKETSRRYPNAEALLSDLRSVQQGGTVRPRIDARSILRRGSIATLSAVVLFAAWEYTQRPSRHITSVAVLPAPNRSEAREGGESDFATGMTDLLIGQLSELSALERVISRSSSEKYGGALLSPQRVAEVLQVDAVVQLAATRSGESARVEVALIEAAAGRVIWTRRFERPANDVLSLQREMAHAIARALQLELTPNEEARMGAAAPTVHPEAFALYLQSARTTNDAEKIRLLEAAIGKDSTFALAYAKLAIPYIMESRDRAKADRAIRTALRLDPGLSDGYDALGLLRLWIDREWSAAEAAFRRALVLNVHNSLAHHELALLLMRRGRCNEAISEETEAVVQNPGIASFQSGLAEVHLYCRNYTQAILEFERTLPLLRDSSRTHAFLGDAFFFNRQYTEALVSYRKAPSPVPGWAHAALGNRGPAREQISLLSAQWRRGEATPLMAWNLARLHVSLGENDEAITWLERSSAAGYGIILYLAVQPHFDVLRGDARFQTLMRKVGLGT